METPTDKSPRSLRVVLVLSMIGSGLYLWGNLLLALMMPTFKELVESNPTLIPEEVMIAYERLFEIPRAVFGVCALLNAVSLAGVIMMWRLRPTGFHCYTIAQVLLLIVPLLFMGKAYLGLGDIMMTALFVGIYYVLLRQLGILGAKAESSTTPTEGEQ